jgi:hypothetical protein
MISMNINRCLNQTEEEENLTDVIIKLDFISPI